jgi:hypothetical protein
MAGAAEFLLQYLREADDGVEWRAQFVAHVREEFGLGPVGELCLTNRARQRIGRFLRLAMVSLQFLERIVGIAYLVHEAALGVRSARMPSRSNEPSTSRISRTQRARSPRRPGPKARRRSGSSC